MRALVQRVTSASVTVDDEVVGAIGCGLVVLVGVTHSDSSLTAATLADKVWRLRIFDDDKGVMNLSAADLGHELLVVSQFTLYGDTSRGRRPSWVAAAPPDVAEPLVDAFSDALRSLGARVETGRFRADMQVELVNDGPATLMLDIGEPVSTDSYWANWHRMYDIDGSPLQQRLEIVQRHVREEIARRDGPVRIVSLCAGQGRDVIGALRDNPDASRVRARLIELDPQLVADARAAVENAGLDGVVQVVQADASSSECCTGYVPADIVVACGIFGNISADDIRAFAHMVPMLCAPGALVVWTRHRRPPDLTPDVRAWFAEVGFDEVAFESPDEAGLVAVGVHRLAVAPQPLRVGVRMFTFVGDGGVF